MWRIAELSEAQQRELELAVEKASAQWLDEAPTPAVGVEHLDRVLLFLKQTGGASRQAQHVAFMAFTFGALVVRAQPQWRWASVSDDEQPNPALVSADGRHACLPIEVVTEHVLGRRSGGLVGLFERLVNGPLPTTGADQPVMVW